MQYHIGGGFIDDISIYSSYIIYGHGEMSKAEHTFILNENQNILYMQDPGESYNSNDATALWDFLSSFHNLTVINNKKYLYNLRVYLKLISGYIDDEVLNFKYKGRYNNKEVYIFKNVRFHEGSTEVNNLDIYFTPLQRTDITSEKPINDNEEIIKSGIYAVPIGFNYPIKNYCQNIGKNGSLLFGEYKKRHQSVNDIDDINIFMKYSNDTYFCGLPGKIGKEYLISDNCKLESQCNLVQNKLINHDIKPYNYNSGIFINNEFRYKPIKLSTILNNYMNGYNGTYILPICRVGEPSNKSLQISQIIKNRKPDIEFSIKFIKNIIIYMLLYFKNKNNEMDDNIFSLFHSFINKNIGKIDLDQLKLETNKYNIFKTKDISKTIYSYNNIISKTIEKKDTSDKKIEHLTRIVFSLTKLLISEP